MGNKLFYQNFSRYRCLESVEKNSHELYLCYCGRQECLPGHQFTSKRTEFLLHIVLEGSGTFTAEGKIYNLKKNSIFLICPEQLTSYQSDSEEPWTYMWIAFNGLKAESLLRYAGLTKETPVAYLPDTIPYETAIQGILSSCQLSFSNELRRSEYLYSFVAKLAEDLHPSDNENNEFSYSHQAYVEYALDFIEHNYHYNIKVSDIADYVGINRSYLTKCFKKSLQLSPHEYLIDYRMNKAKDLLANTKIPINQIASQVGYEDPLAFSKAFKLFTGVSPKTYRES